MKIQYRIRFSTTFNGHPFYAYDKRVRGRWWWWPWRKLDDYPDVGFVRRAVRDMIAVDLANGNEAELITKFKTKGDDI